jgi:NDP-sugar pyrophosphorylase family protein
VRSGFREEAREQRGALRRLAFTGVHVVEPRAFGLMSETGAFSIIDLYLRLAGEGKDVRAVDVGDAEWFEIGTPERLAAARARFAAEA